MTDSAHYHDPRLVQLYDLQNRWGADDDFFLALANEKPGSHILDLGCGTGRLTVALVQAGHQVTGIDPAQASLEMAQQKAGAGAVNWIHGTAADAPDNTFDLCLMTSHVAQVFVDGTDWHATLRDIHRALVPGGRLAFDMRDPAARAWEGWDSGDERDVFTLPGGEQVETWCKVDSVKGNVVSFAEYTRFLPAGDVLTSTSCLRFRSEAELRESLKLAGFVVEEIYGGWHGEKVGGGCGELVVVAWRS